MPKGSSTHDFIDVAQIKDGVVSLRDKSLRAVLMVSSLNFDLKSSDEKEALIMNFQRFLNSMRDYSVQIVIQSRPLELAEYFVYLHEHQEKQENELLKIQTAEYINFVQEMVTISNIMNKYFYVVVPYNLTVAEKKGVVDKLWPGKRKDDDAQRQIRYEEARNQLLMRVSEVASLLGELELRSILLSDKELIELFHGLYNPGTDLAQGNLELLIATGDKEKEIEETPTQ